MPIATGLAIGLGVAGAAAGVGGAAIQAHAAGKAAKGQSDAAAYAADLNYKASKEALDFQKKQYETSRTDLAPWLKAGTGAINTLSGLLNNGEFKDWTGSFQAPTSVTEQNDPGYQFRLQEGQKALERSAAARGGVLSGGTAKALTQFSQDTASNEYSNVYNRSYNEYATKYNEFNNNQTNKFNRYATLSGVGQQTGNQLSLLGENSATNMGNILLTSANTRGGYAQDAAAARASGYVGGANAYSGALSGGMSNLQQLLLLSQLGKT